MTSPRVVALQDVPASPPVDPSEWTAVVPAAGRGTRLGAATPKILYPLLGRPILAWLVDALAPVCGKVVLVLAPDAMAAVEPVARGLLGDRLEVAVQPVPRGMGDAVACAQEAVRTRYALVVWGDQVTLRARTLEACARVHATRPGATLTLPTLWKKDPYIHFERDAEGRLAKVLQAREGEIRSPEGENDCGVFLFTTAALFPTLAQARRDGVGVGAATGEFNLLQVLPRFEAGPGAVATVRIDDPSETLGVNTPADVEAAERVLLQRRPGVVGSAR